VFKIMKSLAPWAMLACALAVVPRAEGLEVAFGSPPVTVIDNLAGDADPTVGTILFGPTPFAAGYTVGGTLIESITAAGATQTLTNCVVERTGGAGLVDVLLATNSTFPAIVAPSDCALNIDGVFVDAGVTGNVGVTMTGITNLGPIGILGPFAPLPLTFAGTTGLVAKGSDVTSYEMRLTFRLTDVGDRVTLPTSAHLSVGMLGACCNVPANTCTQLAESTCNTLGADYAFRGVGTPCGADGACVPTMSQWGVTVMVLLIATAGTTIVMRRRAKAA